MYICGDTYVHTHMCVRSLQGSGQTTCGMATACTTTSTTIPTPENGLPTKGSIPSSDPQLGSCREHTTVTKQHHDLSPLGSVALQFIALGRACGQCPVGQVRSPGNRPKGPKPWRTQDNLLGLNHSSREPCPLPEPTSWWAGGRRCPAGVPSHAWTVNRMCFEWAQI